MISHVELNNLPNPKELLGDDLFYQLQDLVINTMRANGTPVLPGESAALGFRGCGGMALKVNQELTKVVNR